MQKISQLLLLLRTHLRLIEIRLLLLLLHRNIPLIFEKTLQHPKQSLTLPINITFSLFLKVAIDRTHMETTIILQHLALPFIFYLQIVHQLTKTLVIHHMTKTLQIVYALTHRRLELSL